MFKTQPNYELERAVCRVDEQGFDYNKFWLKFRVQAL